MSSNTVAPTGASRLSLATLQAIAAAAHAAQPWTTRFDPTITRRFGVEEIHNVWFLPDSWHPGIGAETVTLLIPECELQLVSVLPDGEPLGIISRRKHDFNVKRWTRNACALAADKRASLSFGCDTREQAELAAKRAGKWLPKNYSRVALERMYEPETRIRKNLS
jgi:hypothetical protein